MSRTFAVDLDGGSPVSVRVEALRNKIAQDPDEGVIQIGAVALAQLLDELAPAAEEGHEEGPLLGEDESEASKAGEPGTPATAAGSQKAANDGDGDKPAE